jgi:hypothetical protein
VLAACVLFSLKFVCHSSYRQSYHRRLVFRMCNVSEAESVYTNWNRKQGNLNLPALNFHNSWFFFKNMLMNVSSFILYIIFLMVYFLLSYSQLISFTCRHINSLHIFLGQVIMTITLLWFYIHLLILNINLYHTYFWTPYGSMWKLYYFHIFYGRGCEKVLFF